VAPERSGRVPAGAAALLIAATACTPAPSAPVVADPTRAAVATSEAGTTPRPSRVDGASIETHLLDGRYVPGSALVSTGTQIVWSAGAASSSEIWRYVPGSPQPERVYASPRAESTITSVVGSSAGYAFVEQSKPAFGDGGWRVWFLSGSGAEPVQLAEGNARQAGHAPTIAMDDTRIAWAGFDEPPGDMAYVLDHAVSRLATASASDPRHVTLLLEQPVRTALLWFPCLNRNELWYGTIHGDLDLTGVGDEFHVEMLDLASPTSAPVRFVGSGNDFNPAANDAFVVWKTGEAGDSALNWGTLKVLDRRTQRVETILTEPANRPSIGDRYLAFDEIFHARLVVYDLATGRLLELASSGGAEGGRNYGGESLHGRLLTFFEQAPDGGQPRIGWAILPE
jgi:hypothetical protein